MTNPTHVAATSTAESTGEAAVALSGADNTGKAARLRGLARRIAPLANLAGPLDDHDPRWSGIHETGMASWWFEKAPVEEVADVLACSYLERAHQPRHAGLRLVDRGIPMLEASLAATVAVRDDLDAPRAAERACQLLARYDTDLRVAEAAQRSVVLLHDADPAEAAARSLAREPAADCRYAAYQRSLNIQVHRLVSEGRFETVMITGDRPILAIQARAAPAPRPHGPTRAAVRARGPDRDRDWRPVRKRQEHGGGLPALPAWLRQLKIEILLAVEEAAARSSISDPYREPAEIQAELLADSLDRFAAAHHFLTRVSLESVHRDEPASELRELLGGNLTLTYLDTPAGTREHRGVAGPADVRERDAVKHRRGAAAVAALADVVISNEGTRLSLARQLDVLSARLGQPGHPPRTVPVNSLGLPVHLESYLTRLISTVSDSVPGMDLVAVTGSGARGNCQHGWSDLDVFVIAATSCLPGLRHVLAEVASDLDGVKLGITLITRAECAACVVTPRVLHVLRSLREGGDRPALGPARHDLDLANPQTDATESLRDGTQAAVESVASCCGPPQTSARCSRSPLCSPR